MERPPRRSIDLDIAGEEFMLQGRFSDWESALAFGPDLDRVSVRLVVDATSARTTVSEGPSLFAFHSRTVETTGEGAYRVLGTFTGPEGSKPVELSVESPLGHTAVAVLTFSAKKQDFGEGWRDLIENVVPFLDGPEGPVRPAHAWLVPPSLASA
jgi:polyisoprenoid-binding protein YceI